MKRGRSVAVILSGIIFSSLIILGATVLFYEIQQHGCKKVVQHLMNGEHVDEFHKPNGK